MGTLKVTTIQNEDGVTPVEIVGGITTGDITATSINGISTDTTDWTEYFDSSTISGWVDTYGVSVPEGWIKILKLGVTVHVSFSISGTSNSALATFTLPYQAASSYNVRAAALGLDNGSYLATPVLIALDEETSLVKLIKDWSSAGWTTSGDKSVIGSFSFITD